MHLPGLPPTLSTFVCPPLSAALLSRRDFQAFVRAAEKFGRTELDKIASEVEGKTAEEVAAYSKARVIAAQMMRLLWLQDACPSTP